MVLSSRITPTCRTFVEMAFENVATGEGIGTKAARIRPDASVCFLGQLILAGKG